jgi:NDP-sugar pyrophosphorylase family protein/thiamine kinase-like enzyme
MTETLNVFILAAGFGERLLPITSYIPKPLLPVAGKPVLQLILDRISELPLKHIGMNLHHKKTAIKEWLNCSTFRDKVRLFEEVQILGTGGALKNAERFLSEGMFLVHNADILSDTSLLRLLEEHKASGNLATLAVHDFSEFNNVSIDSEGLLTGVGNRVVRKSSEVRKVAFTGIAVYNREFLSFLPDGASSVVGAWINAAESGRIVGTHDVSGCYWTDIGTPPAYASAVIDKMRSEGETVYIHPSSQGCRNAMIDGYVVIEEGCTIHEGVSIRNCIVLPGGILGTNRSYKNCIVGQNLELALNEEEIVQSSGSDHMILIGTGGSDRKYFRVREGKGSLVIARYGHDDQDFHRHLHYTDFFMKHNAPVPKLLRADEVRMEAAFEDLGDLSLYSWLKCGRTGEEVETIYRKVIDIALMIHTVMTEHVSECPMLGERVFDYEHLRWETHYFMENFVGSVRNMKVGDTSRIEDEFQTLAAHVDSFPKTVMHRDFQSQNIMITRGMPRLIDYQGARIGPPAYDIASLLWDPYYRIEGEVRERLINYYTGKMRGHGVQDFDTEGFRDMLLSCRIQRHMQALGAYGYLSMVGGKRYFLKHVEEGLRLLKEDMILAKKEYPSIYELVLEL